MICVLDAARADHFGCYGYPRDTTPNVDALARDGVVFRQHFTTYPLTAPATASLFTGLYPDTHLMMQRWALPRGTFTLAAGLKAAGWRTAIFSSNPSASPEVGLGEGSDEVIPPRSLAPPAGEPHGRGGQVQTDLPPTGTWSQPEPLTRAFAEWLDDRPAGRAAKGRPSRFFAYLHLLPPHTPYAAPEAFMQAVVKKKAPITARGRYEFPQTAPSRMAAKRYSPERWADLYDANLRWGDWGAGEVVKTLRVRGLLDHTLLIVTADHGEAFGEHGYVYHMHGVYDELVHIPLVMRFPGPPGRRPIGEVSALTQTVDLLPTICDLYQVPYPRDRVQGRSLVPLLDGEQASVRGYVFATSQNMWPTYLVRDTRWSLMLYAGGELRSLFDLPRDPGERRDVIAAHPDVVAKMTAAFQSFARTQARPLTEFVSPGATASPAPAAKGPKLSGKTRRELKALGYVE